jgi:protein TonB
MSSVDTPAGWSGGLNPSHRSPDAATGRQGREVLLGHLASVALHGGLLLILVSPWWQRPVPAGVGGAAAPVFAVSATMAPGEAAGSPDAAEPATQPLDLVGAPPVAATAVAADTQPLVAEPAAAAPVPVNAEAVPVEAMDLALEEAAPPLLAASQALPLPPPVPPRARRPEPVAARPIQPPTRSGPSALAASPAAPPAVPASLPAAPGTARGRVAEGGEDRGASQGALPSAGQGQEQAGSAGQADSPVLITNPRYRRPPRPADYPSRAIDLGQTGSVTLRALVSPQGETRNTRVHRSSGSGLLDQAALAAVKNWEFQPAEVDGRPVHAWVEVRVHFRLN